MGYYKNKTYRLMESGAGSEEKTREVIAMLDACIFEPLRVRDHAAYWAAMRKMHEIYEGCHYDEEFAMWEVEQMRHTDKGGIEYRGAHWTVDAINKVYMQHRQARTIKASVTLYDFYVALHSWWHDNICQDVADFGDKAEAKNIERAINYFFMDDDAPDGKIWRYYAGMRK